MKKKNILAIFLGLFMCVNLFCISACKETTVEESSSQTVEPSIEYSDVSIVKDGKSEYAIVLPDSAATMEEFAASELQTFIELSTGVTLPIVSDYGLSYKKNSKYLAIGNTSFIDSVGITLNEEELQSSGFILATKGDSVFMAGASMYGSLYAVYEFLNYIIGFETYTVDEVFYTKNTEIKLPIFDNTVIPSFDVRVPGWGKLYVNTTYQNRLRAQRWEDFWMIDYGVYDTHGLIPYSTYGAQHPDWFNASGSELCYSNEELWGEILARIKKEIQNNPEETKKYIGILQADMTVWCSCDRCKEVITQYGSNSATILRCCNYIAQEIEKWFEETGTTREFFITMYAYQATLAAPQGLEVGEHVAILFAPQSANYSYAFDHEENATIWNALTVWSELTDNLVMYNYSTNFTYYLLAHNSFDSLAANNRLLKELGFDLVYELGQHSQTFDGTGFYDLRCYLQSKLLWNVNYNMNDLIESYFENCFKDGSEYMLKFFNEMRVLYSYNTAYNGFNALIYENLLRADLWPKGSLDTWNGYCDQAINAIAHLQDSDIETYNKVVKRINRERAMILYLYVELWSHYFTSAELYDLKMQFKQIAMDCNFSKTTEGADNITTLWTQWGI